MNHLITSFLARGFKFTDLFWIGGGALLLFIFAVGLGRLIHVMGEDYPEEEPDSWNDEPWI